LKPPPTCPTSYLVWIGLAGARAFLRRERFNGYDTSQTSSFRSRFSNPHHTVQRSLYRIFDFLSADTICLFLRPVLVPRPTTATVIQARRYRVCNLSRLVRTIFPAHIIVKPGPAFPKDWDSCGPRTASGMHGQQPVTYSTTPQKLERCYRRTYHPSYRAVLHTFGGRSVSGRP